MCSTKLIETSRPLVADTLLLRNKKRGTQTEIVPLRRRIDAVPCLGHSECSRLESELTLDSLTLREGEMYSHIAKLG